MSFLTEYFDNYRQHPMRKTKICRPEDRWAKIEGKWLDPKTGSENRVWTDEEIEKFINDTMITLRGRSTYFNDYCAHLNQEFKTRVPQPKVKSHKVVEEESTVSPPLAMKDTELMKMAKEMYERDLDKPTLEPLGTNFRMLGYSRPCYLKTGISEYQGGIARLAYELVRDDKIPRFHAHTCGRPTWGYPPEGQRQPELDGAPFDGERLY